MKVLKYSKEMLLKFANKLNEKIYLFFYDLNCEDFNDTAHELDEFVRDIEMRIIKARNESFLIVFCSINFQKLQCLVDKLDFMDIGEFAMSEYSNKQEVDSSILCSSRDKKYNKSIYVNKDEKIMQLYNLN